MTVSYFTLSKRLNFYRNEHTPDRITLVRLSTNEPPESVNGVAVADVRTVEGVPDELADAYARLFRQAPEMFRFLNAFVACSDEQELLQLRKQAFETIGKILPRLIE